MSDEVDTPQPPDESTELDTEAGAHDYRTLANGVMSPRHRRFAQLVAEGKSGEQISSELGYVASRISVLKRNPLIAAEVLRLQERIFEETIGQRLKSFAEPALSNIFEILTDRSGRVKVGEKMALSQWVVEKLDGKATQKTDIGENLLAVLMDRLDARRTGPQVLPSESAIDVTPAPSPPSGQESPPAKPQDDDLSAWIAEFSGTTPRSE